MAWITLTRDGLKTKLSKPELEKIPREARAAGMSADDVMDKAIADTVKEIQGMVAKHNPIGLPGTLPEELEKAAWSLIRRDLFSRIPGLVELFDDTRKTEARWAESIMRMVLAGDYVIVPPEDLAPKQAINSSSTIVNSRPDHVGGGRLNGL